MPISKICLVCSSGFKVIKARENTAKYCSKECRCKATGAKKKGIKRSDIVKRKISQTIKEQYIKGRTPWNKGRIGVWHHPIKGKLNNLWKGGTSKLWWRIVTHIEYKRWRQSVYERDGFTCQGCFKTGGRLEAHHIKAKAPVLREYLKKNKTEDIDEILKGCPLIIDINNGLTLCKSCHKQTDNYAGKSKTQ